MNIAAGMLITAYHKGIHRVLKVIPAIDHTDHPSWQMYPPELRHTPTQIEYRQEFTLTGKPLKNQPIRKCAISYCAPVTPAIIDTMIADHQNSITNLMEIRSLVSP